LSAPVAPLSGRCGAAGVESAAGNVVAPTKPVSIKVLTIRVILLFIVVILSIWLSFYFCSRPFRHFRLAQASIGFTTISKSLDGGFLAMVTGKINFHFPAFRRLVL